MKSFGSGYILRTPLCDNSDTHGTEYIMAALLVPRYCCIQDQRAFRIPCVDVCTATMPYIAQWGLGCKCRGMKALRQAVAAECPGATRGSAQPRTRTGGFLEFSFSL